MKGPNQFTAPWTQQEIEYLKENYPKMGAKNIAKDLKRSYDAIISKAGLLKLKSGMFWTQEEITFLIDSFRKKENNYICKYLNRSLVSIESKAGKLGLIPSNKWTPKEILILKKYYSSGNIAKIIELTNKTKNSIMSKARGLKLYQNKTNYIGVCIGTFKIIEEINCDKKLGRMYKCRCSCGKYRITNIKDLKWKTNKLGCQKCLLGEKNPCFKGIGKISGSYICHLKNGARHRGLSFSISKEDIWKLFLKQDEKCALSGEKLFFDSSSYRCDGNASLDRIDSSKGYTIDNIQWVHKDVNFIKQDYTEKALLDWCLKIVKHNKLI